MNPSSGHRSRAGHNGVARHSTELRIPADQHSARAARLLASAIGTGVGADVNTIEDLRLLVNEACGLLLECSVPGTQLDELVVTFEPAPDGVTVTVTRPGSSLVDRPTSISEKILDTMSTDWQLDGATVRVRLDLPPGIDHESPARADLDAPTERTSG